MEEGPVAMRPVYIPVRDARPVHGLWKQVGADLGRYKEEVSAAADFIQHASPLMSNHLKNKLLQVSASASVRVKAGGAAVHARTTPGTGY